MRRVSIDEIIRAEVAHEHAFKNTNAVWDVAVQVGECLDMAMSEIGGWAIFVGKVSPADALTDCLFELYPRGDYADRAWELCVESQL